MESMHQTTLALPVDTALSWIFAKDLQEKVKKMQIRYDFEPTPEQAKAINCLDSDVAVVAGAGAGKTRVLIYRILNIVLNDKADFNNIVAITFTEKAAAEMKVKLRKEASNQIKLNPLLKNKLSKAPTALISTIHGFCSNIIRRFALTIGYVPEFTVLDQEDSSRLLLKSITEVLEANENINDPVFIRFKAKAYNLKENLEYAYNKMREFGYRLDEAVDISKESFFTAKAYAKENLANFISTMERAYDANEISRSFFAEDLLPQWSDIGVLFKRLQKDEKLALHEKEELILYLESLHGLSSLGKAYEEYKDVIINQSKMIPFFFTEKDQKNVILRFSQLLKDIDTRYNELKKELSSLDFIDLQQKALEIIKNPDVKQQLKKEYLYIMIDEYQDTNYLQQQIVDELWQDNTNLFIVGDPKQSIYRFRGAEVALFEDTSLEIEKKSGKKVKLSHNFRSNSTLIDFYNDFFSEFMPGEDNKPYAIGYENAKSPKEDPDNDAFNIIACHYNCREDPETIPYRVWQAKAIARLIGEAVKEEKAKYGDYAVLFAKRSTGLSELEEEFSQSGIPFVSGNSLAFYQREEIRECLALIDFLSNPTDDLVLAATLKGPFFGITDQKLYEIFQKTKKENLPNIYATILRYGGNSFLVKSEQQKFGIQDIDDNSFEDLAKKLAELCRYYGYKNLDDILADEIKKSQFNLVLLAQNMGKERLANVEKLLEVISLEVQKGKSNNEIVEILKVQREKDASDAQVIAEDQDRVKIMTIHASKGLEFKNVIVAGLIYLRSSSYKNSMFHFDKNEGLLVSLPSFLSDLKKYVPCTDPRFYRYLDKEIDEDSYEDQRLLYVAFTRAIEKLYLVFAGKIVNKNESLTSPLLEMFDWDFNEKNVRIKNFYSDFTAYDYINYQTTIKIGIPPVKIGKVSLPPRYRALSPTALVQFDLCPRLFYLEQRLKVPSTDLVTSKELTKLELGSEFKDSEITFEEGNNSKATIGTVLHKIFATAESFDEAFQIFNVNNLQSDYLPIIQNFFAAEFFHKKGEREVALSWYLPEHNLRIIGFADKVIVEPELVTVVDFKTQLRGDFAKKAKQYELQLAVYSKVLEESYKRPVKAFVYFPYPDQAYEIDTKKALAKFYKVLERISKVLDEDKLPDPSEDCVSACQYYSLCKDSSI
ncbi:MAG: UvrD-helicase domain-containing protein [Firmicutes bacterium]|nr:UvrD-helicase domain-containing protein [Bacillota bacterium]